MASPLNAGSIHEYLDDDEVVRHRLVSRRGPVEREMDGSVSTLSPAGDCGSLLAVTNARVIDAIGGGDRGGEDATVSIPYTEIDDVTVDDGFLSSSFTLETTDGERYTLDPDEGDMSEVATAIRQLVEKLERVRTMLEKAERNTSPVDPEPALDVDEIQSASAASSFARAYATLDDLSDDPLEGLDDLRERIESAWLENYLERAEALREQAVTAAANGREDDALVALEAAIATYDEAHDIARDHGFHLTEAIEDARAATLERTRELRSGPVARGMQAVERARSATGDAAVRAWLRAYREYGDALEEDLVAVPIDVPDDDAAIRYQRAWVAGAAVDALVGAARRTLDAVDEPADHDDAEIQRAEACIDEARSIAQAHEMDVAALDDLSAAVERVVGLQQWEWGGEA